MAKLTTAADSLRKEVLSFLDTTAKEMRCEELAMDIPLVMEPAQWNECSIYRVPKKLRRVNKEAYTPKLISIGPLHHGENELCAMEMLKLRYLREFCYRTGKDHKDIASVIEANELKIRRCYDEIFDISSEDFVKMVLLDSAFIIEHFLKSTVCRENESNASGEAGSNGKEDRNDCITSTPLLRKHITQDLLLLENQLPFFILDELYAKNFNPEQNKYGSFLMLVSKYLFPNIEEKETIIDEKELEVKHFTDLMRHFHYPTNFENTGPPIETLHNAKKLDEAGVVFKKPEERRRLLDINFKKSKLTEIFPCFTCSWLLHCLPCLDYFPCLVNTQTFLEVPCLEVHDETEGIFRNLMALELCHYPFNTYICNYIVLLDFLINTRDDVELLVEKGIIVNKLGSNKAVATMVNKLGLAIEQNTSCYHELAQQLNDYYDNDCNRNMGSLRTIYFGDIWRGTATFIGVIVLLVTFLNFLRPFVLKNI
ncbi:UPF0481 protein At3g47200-like [Quercus robur]|uniref:UPF0481 protein At3g47200-like n=1 Tax=Quercus robur TaxID=38942 RepID=UPI00216159E5|nr:UPF0481 protein At3g47200-like [Quercus robur]